MSKTDDNFLFATIPSAFCPCALPCNWHRRQSSYPRDYDIEKPGNNDVFRSAYTRFGTCEEPYETTYQHHCKQRHLKPFYEERHPPAPLINESSIKHLPFTRDTGAPQRGYGSVVPLHKQPHTFNYFSTVYSNSYKYPFPYTPSELAKPEYCSKYHRRKSQLTNAAKCIWQDECNIYSVPQESVPPTLDGLL